MKKYKYYLIYKPFGMLPQFSDNEGRPTLKDLYDFPKDVYSVGRLDMDSEGLLILTNDKSLNHKLLHPSFKHDREYLVQVDGDITEEAIMQLAKGVVISVNKKKHNTLPAKARKKQEPNWLEERNPPVRFRKSIPTSFVSLSLIEGKNRQVRKMTASVGFPTLRLIRTRIEGITLNGMKIGEVKEVNRNLIYKLLFENNKK
ncbi:pseudouridine synthase [Sediminitomix flava]|uniref:Pseudouridine synthase n=1 Tax=Sediminitomix flava TaxID=379075 RepID=A0A315ZBT3_SEDFL|nr:pseudouridine synthase [Sediminitomix flava]PWJ42164.1 ribosomal large subunit pseudouridine synthase E [Sediminitomix flava]